MNGYEDTECEKHFTPPDAMTNDKMVEKVAKAIIVSEYPESADMTWKQLQKQAPTTASKSIDIAKLAIPIIQAEVWDRAHAVGFRDGVLKARADRDREIGEWGEEYCQSGSHGEDFNDMSPTMRKNCYECWQALKSGTWKGKKDGAKRD